MVDGLLGLDISGLDSVRQTDDVAPWSRAFENFGIQF